MNGEESMTRRHNRISDEIEIRKDELQQKAIELSKDYRTLDELILEICKYLGYQEHFNLIKCTVSRIIIYPTKNKLNLTK